MATERNVVDFKIHNLTEEQFQELKAQGKIDPNAVYCTPDMTKERLDELDTKTTSLESKTTLLDTKTTSLENNKQDKGDYATNTALSEGLSQKQDKGDYATNTALSEGLSQKQDVATAINYDNITNCITEIPQDIKLEINSENKLVVKAGTIYYVPNGVGVFEKRTITTDSVWNYTGSATGQRMIIISTGKVDCPAVTSVFSGSTMPTPNGVYWYNTDENIVYAKTSETNIRPGISLSLGVISIENGAVKSIDQVFNGFGYIGSTLFALPGVKGLVPNGRNEDGTLKNVDFATSTVLTSTDSSTSTNILLINNTSVLRITATNYFYDEQKNIIINKYNNANTQILFALYGFNETNNGVVSEFATKTAFRAIDYNDTDFIAHQVMPSNRRIDLTLGASGASYTAPADGWLVLNKLSSGTSYQFVQIYNTKNADRRIGAATTNGVYLCATMPLAKGDRVLVEYSATGATKLFRFIYANGAK